MDLSRATTLEITVTAPTGGSAATVSQELPSGYDLVALRGFEVTDGAGQPQPLLDLQRSATADSPQKIYVSASFGTSATGGTLTVLIAPID